MWPAMLLTVLNRLLVSVLGTAEAIRTGSGGNCGVAAAQH